MPASVGGLCDKRVHLPVPGPLAHTGSRTAVTGAKLRFPHAGLVTGSRVRDSGFIGYFRSAGRVLVVIVYRDLDGELPGMNAWPASAIWPATEPNGGIR